MCHSRSYNSANSSLLSENEGNSSIKCRRIGSADSGEYMKYESEKTAPVFV